MRSPQSKLAEVGPVSADVTLDKTAEVNHRTGHLLQFQTLPLLTKFRKMDKR